MSGGHYLKASPGQQLPGPSRSASPNGGRLLVFWEKARRDPMDFLRYWVWTNDQHDMESEGGSIKPFPVDKPHIEPIVRLWQWNRLLVLVKSRQMLQTWLFVALNVWLAIFRRGSLIMLQSQREEDAIGDFVNGDGLLGRARFILDHMPGRDVFLPDYEPKHNQIKFTDRRSTMWAIPQGGNIIRQRTCTSILSDEAAFQPEMEDSYTASRPTIRGSGRAAYVTTADLSDGGHTKQLYEDTLGDGSYREPGYDQPSEWEVRESKIIIPANEIDVGLNVRPTSTGFVAVTLGMGADPEEFTPERVEEERAGMPGWKFEKEYLRNWQAQQGQPVFDEKWVVRQERRCFEPVERLDWQPVVEDGEPVKDKHGNVQRRLVKKSNGRILVYVRPDAERRAAIGADVGEGVGKSDSAACVMYADTREQAAAFCDNDIRPKEFGRLLVLLAEYYNGAVVCPAAKMHGLTTIRAMADAGYTRIWRHKARGKVLETPTNRLGWRGGESSSELLFGEWVDMVEGDKTILHDVKTVHQHRQYVFDDDGRITWNQTAHLNVRAREAHGDAVIAAALANQAAKDIHAYRQIKPKEAPVGSLAWRRERRKARQQPERSW